MKKMFFAIAAVVAMSFAACGNQQAGGANDTDSVAQDNVVVEDTLAGDVEAEEVVAEVLAEDSVEVDTVVAE